MWTGFIALFTAILKAIPRILDFWEKADQKKNEADAIHHRDGKRSEDDAAVASARATFGGVPVDGARTNGEQQKNPNDIRTSVDECSGSISRTDSGIPEGNQGLGIRDRKEIIHDTK